MIEKKFNNQQLADIFNRIADLLEIKGEVIYKTLAYRKAADSLVSLGMDVNDVWKNGKLTDIPGVGKAISEKIEELLSTGQLSFLINLEQEVPPDLLDVLRVPDLGPKKVALFWKEAGITNVSDLEAAAQAGKLRGLKGMGPKSEARVLAGIESLAKRTDRIPLGSAWPFAESIKQELSAISGVEKIETAGSLRRMKETIGDLDLISASTDPVKLMYHFVNHPEVVEIVSHGEIKSSVVFANGFRVQLWVHPPGRFGTALQYGTGSKDHNVSLREVARKKGFSLSDQALTDKDGVESQYSTEEALYNVLGMPYIHPELREDRGEIKAALDDTLPKLIVMEDIISELHSHSVWSDGVLTMSDMVSEAVHRGYHVLAFTDHSVSLGIAGGMSIEEVFVQRDKLLYLREKFGDQIHILHGCEVEIRADGSLDYPDEILAGFDLVIASLHTSLRQPRERVTQRVLNAINNPHVDIIAHPTGRIIPDRAGADLDMSVILDAAARMGVALEINAHPSRLDLNDVYARRAAEMGVLITINTDAHSASDLDLLHFGVATARRGWIEPEIVINTWCVEQLVDWLQSRG